MAWFRRKKTQRQPVQDRKLHMPEGIWKKCGACKEVLYAKAIQDNGMSCPRCDFHFPISVEERIRLIMDEGSGEELDRELYAVDPLKFKDQQSYKDRLKRYQEKTGRSDAVVTMRGRVGGHEIVSCFMDFGFMGGSLGSVVGEKITRGAELALKEKLPFMVVCCSGGARMQEGALSLMQMAKINSALGLLHEAKLAYIAVLTNPTTGGVSASFAMVGDVILAEPGALIGFAGPRVIEQTIGQKLPEGFQRSEFLLKHGMVDQVVPRRELKGKIAAALSFFCGQPTARVSAKAGPDGPGAEASSADGSADETSSAEGLQGRSDDADTSSTSHQLH